jgi:phosphoenolpyruvate-protein phosphotransferase (PTS system enzyme I)
MTGIGVSPGISIGRAFIIEKDEAVISGILLENEEATGLEIDKFNKAVIDSVEEVESIKGNKDISLNNMDIEFLEMQIEFLNDPQIKSDVLEKIKKEHKTANDAIIEVIDIAVQMIKNLDDEYLRTRAVDVQDIGNRIVKHLNCNRLLVNREFSDNTIIIAYDITPSDTLSFNLSKIAGFATQSGGRTSHTAIIAKAKGIPAVVACGNDLLSVKNNDTVILDGSTGDVIIRPDTGIIETYKAKQIKFAEELKMLRLLRDLPAVTTDGQQVRLYANISNADDLEQVFENGGEGIGLLRSELLYMSRNSFPSEEEQFHFYKKVAINSKNKPVIIRTLDIGGDKQLHYFGIPHENNPFLGYRAIRICLNQQDIFFTQLKAILRASAFGKLKIMFPMICNVDEVLQAKDCVNILKQELIRCEIEFDKNIEIGIMIEIPSAALMVDILAKEVDFFSIGTNDLCQYTLAVDRTNERVSALYNHFNPGILRLIANIIEQAHKNGKQVGMCGEMASDPLATLLLLGMGLDEFSMGATSIPNIKKIITGNTILKAGEVLNRVMEMNNSYSIKAYLEKVTK